MKKIIRTLAVVLLLSALLSDLSACRRLREILHPDNGASAEEPTSFLYLFVGLDNAAENTDVLLSVGYDALKNAVTLVQIPRDTYCSFGGSQNKINQYFALLRLQGKTQKEALFGLKDLLEETFGVAYDGCFAIDTAAFSDLVDSIGGVDVTLERDLVLSVDHEEITLAAGKNHLNGALSERFVRSRKGYAGGDLSRLDAQKIFYQALFERLRSGVSLTEAAPAFRILCTEGITDLSLSDALTLYRKYRTALSTASTRSITLPGAPTLSERGLSYYIVARDGAKAVLETYLFAEGEFDPKSRLCDETLQNFADIYYDTGIGAEVISSP